MIYMVISVFKIVIISYVIYVFAEWISRKPTLKFESSILLKITCKRRGQRHRHNVSLEYIPIEASGKRTAWNTAELKISSWTGHLG